VSLVDSGAVGLSLEPDLEQTFHDTFVLVNWQEQLKRLMVRAIAVFAAEIKQQPDLVLVKP